MIEYCTKKIMMATISSLMILCIAVLYLEDTLMQHQHEQHAGPPAALPVSPASAPAASGNLHSAATTSCAALLQQQQAASDYPSQACQPCTEFEQRVASQLTAGSVMAAACADTGFKRLVGGSSGCPEAWISCQPKVPSNSASERVKFFVAQGASLLLFLIAFGCVRRRERQLDQLLTDRVSRQLAAGV
ncbi:hypothetical protein BOX15_Mlig008745g6 [Macrostomum lignano]|uniref:Transmembrane protein n=1 Tax=Macrostomum lignano TaxID=282301 RepID=A0A267G3Y4_9PLAT|nr:hypothetical protein BOX15_Mlig008745g6 [Macrostomum lignano]